MHHKCCWINGFGIRSILLFFLFAPITSCQPSEIEVYIPPSVENCFTAFLITPIQGNVQYGQIRSYREGSPSFEKETWKVHTGTSPVMITMDEIGNYAATLKLIPPAQGEYTFIFGSYADGAVFFKGNKIAAFAPHERYWTNSVKFTIPLKAKGDQIILTFGKRYKRCGFFLKTENREVVSSLALIDSPFRKENLFISSLAVSANRRFVKEGQTVRITIKNEAAIPDLDTKVRTYALFKSPEGTVFYCSEPKDYLLSHKKRSSLSFSWKFKEVSSFRVIGEIHFLINNEPAGILTRDFYVASLISKRLKSLKEELSTAEDELKHPIPLAGLKLEIASLLNDKPLHTEYTGKRIIEALERVPVILDFALQGKDPLKDERGYIERAYFSAIDNSYQPYRLYIPYSYTPEEPAPLFVYLHGYVPSYTKAEWVDEPAELTKLIEKYGAILAVPFGRSNTDFQSVGEIDVIRVISEVHNLYTINRNKMYIIGYSMGGSGMWTIMQHYPDVFAGGISLGGRTDYYYWHNLDRNDIPAYKPFLINNNNPIDVPLNFLQKSFWIFHGTADTLVKQGHSTRMHRVLTEHNIKSKYTPIENGLHWISSAVYRDHDIVSWLLTNGKVPFPSHIDFTTYTLKYNRAYWTEIAAFEKWGVPARITGNLTEKGFDITCTNIAKLKLSVPPSAGNAKTVGIILNGKSSNFKIPENRIIEITISETTVESLKKSKNLSGPLKEAFNSPFIIVYGPDFSGRSYYTKALLFKEEWEAFAKGSPDIIADKDLTKKIIAKRNLVLFEDPVKGTYLAKILEKTPVQITKDYYRIKDKQFSSKRKGLAFIYPNPENATRYIVVFSGLRWGESLPINHKLDHIPDYIIFSSKTNWDGSNKAVCAGFFDINWKFSEELFFSE